MVELPDAPSGVVLRVKGVPVPLARMLDADDGTRTPVIDTETGEPLTDVVDLKFSNNVVAGIEELFNGAENFELALGSRPVKTVRDVIALALRQPQADVGERMLPGAIGYYKTAVETAWAIAMGVDPTVAARVLKAGRSLAVEERASVDAAYEALAEGTQEAAAELSRGTDGSPPG